MQNQNPVIKDYILSSTPFVLSDTNLKTVLSNQPFTEDKSAKKFNFTVFTQRITETFIFTKTT